MTIYVVKEGDTLTSIAASFSTTEQRIITDNGLTSIDDLVVGEALVILIPNETYTAAEGDTLSSIAQSYNTTVKALLRNNPNLNGNPLIYPGQTVVISYQGEDRQRRGIETNGYAYPFISEEVLRRTLPYLTYLTIFTYGFTAEGTLIIPDDTRLIDIARSYDVAPIMLISTLTEDGTFSNELSRALFSDEALQDRLIAAIIDNMKQKGYYGLDVDFEFIYPSDREGYVSFVRKLKSALEENGFILIVALAPKTSDDMMGLLYEGHDYAALGAVADKVLLMTYEWGYTYGPPMAVSPLPNVERVIAYGVSRIEPSKIFMGVPFYGYDWKLPFVRGESRADSLGNIEAVELARKERTQIEYDENAQAPFFYYSDNDGAEHVVWFGDARSIQAQLGLVPKYGLNGAAFWTIMKYFPQGWLVINSLFNITSVI